MPSARAYTRSELEGLRRGALQSLYKVHNLRGANGKTDALVDGLLAHFASPAFAPSQPEGGVSTSPRRGLAPSHAGRPPTASGQARAMPPTKASAGIGGPRKSPRRIAGLKGARTAGARLDPKQGGRTGPTESKAQRPLASSTARVPPSAAARGHMNVDTAAGPSSITQEMIASTEVRALLEERDRHWQQKLKLADDAWTEKLASVEAEFEARLRLVMAEQEESPARASDGMEEDEEQGMSPVRLGKRPMRDEDLAGTDVEASGGLPSRQGQEVAGQAESALSQPMRRSVSPSPRKRARLGPPNTSPTAAAASIPIVTPPAADGPAPRPAPPHTPTPGAAQRSTLAPPLPPHTPQPQPDSETSIPRTPSPSHQGVLPDQSQTPGIGLDPADPSYFSDLAHPSRRSMDEDDDRASGPEAGPGLKTPAPLPYPLFATTPRPAEPRSPTIDAPPSARRGKDASASAHMSVLTPGPGRTPSRQRQAPRAVSAAHQDLSTVTESPFMRLAAGPPPTPGSAAAHVLGQGTPLSRRVISADSGPVSALLGPELLGPAAASLAGRGRTLSPPRLLPSPKFADQFTFARPALPSPAARRATPRKDYGLGARGSPAPPAGQPTPRHRTMLGTERYRDTRFGDLEDGLGEAGLGVWGTPRVDLGTSTGSEARRSLGSGQESPTDGFVRVDAPDVSPP